MPAEVPVRLPSVRIRRKREAGLTLIEVLVSIVILSTAMVFILQSMARVAETQRITEQRVKAYLLSASLMTDSQMAILDAEKLPQDKRGTLREGLDPFSWNLAWIPWYDTATPPPAAGEKLPPTPLVLEELTLTWQQGSQSPGTALRTLVPVPKAEGST